MTPLKEITGTMIAEPYICVGGTESGKIYWVREGDDCEECGKPYADFEREKLKELDAEMAHVGISGRDGYFLQTELDFYDSRSMKIMNGDDYADASESFRLLKRAEFLKAVCEKERVEWLPIDANLSEELQREEPKPECGYGRKRSMKQRGENGEWVTVEIQQNHCSAPRPEKCYCPVGYDLRGRIAKEKAKKFSDCLMEPKEPEKEEWREQCQLIVDSTYGKNAIDDMLRDYYTKEEEREFRSDLLHLLEWEIKHGPKKRDSYRKTVIESLRKKYL